MRIFASAGKEDLAQVYMAQMEKGKHVEFVESLQPPLPREKKWVLLVSTLFGCPVGCLFCDAGSYYQGKLSKEQILAQIDFLVNKRFPNGKIPVEKFKIQFARIGEPSINPNMLEVLEELPRRYNAPGLLPSLSTIAPASAERFFERLIEIKGERYAGKRFQLQFSLHTTDEKFRDKLMPVKKWNFPKIAQYAKCFYQKDDRKITLNFALAKETTVDPKILLKHFDPDRFLIKITPINPTHQAVKNRFSSYIDPYQNGKDYPLVKELRACGYEVLISVGENEENHIGSNCGQFIMEHLKTKEQIVGAYSYPVQEYSYVEG